jgi:hypothetical protein
MQMDHPIDHCSIGLQIEKPKEGIMQNSPENILVEYKKADFEQRLYMSLAYRELRDRFTAIDSSEIRDQLTVDKASIKPSGFGRRVMNRFVNALKRSINFPNLALTGWN